MLPASSYAYYWINKRIDEIEFKDDREKWQQIVRSIESFIDPQAYQDTYKTKEDPKRPHDTGKPITQIENLDEKIRKMMANQIKAKIKPREKESKK